MAPWAAGRRAGLALVGACLAARSASATGSDAATCASAQVQFAQPAADAPKRAPTAEQAWMSANWPGYLNGVSLGGSLVIEDWMFYHAAGPFSNEHLHLPKDKQYDHHAWNQDLLKGDLQTAYDTVDCHITKFYSDHELDVLADHGINAARVVVGYWYFDDPELYPGDTWQHLPEGSSPYGVNPDGFITPGPSRLTDLVMRLHSRNIKVMLDMHALPGCSSPHQSYAGIHCEAQAPNMWNGQASEGISGGHKVTRAADGKTWTDVARKITLERVVPWIKFIEGLAPGAIVAYELVNEPDIASGDATTDEIRAMTQGLGKEVTQCLGDLAAKVKVGISTAAKNYAPAIAAKDMLSPQFSGVAHDSYWSDIHHYFYWAGCIDYGKGTFSAQCACEANLPGTNQAGEDVDWAGWMQSGLFEKGGRFYVGEWSAGLGPAHKCQGGVPTNFQSTSTWQAQKWDFMSQYVHYKGLANGQSSFVGDFYWNGRMGHNWDPTPSVCAGESSTDAGIYGRFKSWDWSLLRLIELGVAKKLSTLGWTPTTMEAHKAGSCSAVIPVNCDGNAAPAAPAGGQPGMAPAGGQPGMAFEIEASPITVARAEPARLAQALLALSGCALLVAFAGAAASLHRLSGGARRVTSEDLVEAQSISLVEAVEAAEAA